MTKGLAEFPTTRLRWLITRWGFKRRLQQLWHIQDVRDSLYKLKEEWRDVPNEISTGNVEGVGK